MARFYALSIEPTLFGEVSLIRNWGRIGARGQIRCETFEQPEAATAAFEHLQILKLRKGYLPKAAIHATANGTERDDVVYADD